MWKLTIEDDQGTRTVVGLVRDAYTIGRGEDSTIRLTERNVSRHHASLVKADDGWVLHDASSYNGVYVNGVRVAEPQPLVHGDLVQLGDYRVQIADDAVEKSNASGATAPAVPRGQLLGAQPDRLVMVVGPQPGAEFPLQGERQVIGRGEECDIVVLHGSVSRVHAEIQPLGGGRYEIVDKGSANGVRVNGYEMERALLDARDVVELGDVVLKFIPAGMIYVPGAEESQQLSALLDEAAMAAIEAKQRSGPPLVLRIVAAILILGLLVALGMLVFARDQIAAVVPAITADSAGGRLAGARLAAEKGDLDGAISQLAEIPPDSNLRATADFKDIVERWARTRLDKAKHTEDLDERRVLLEQVSRSTLVAAETRKEAADQIATLSAEGVDITDLPSARRPVAPASSGGIVRKNPFESGGSGVSELGDRAALTRQKNALKAKVAAGTASDGERRLLRALCGQLHDASCSQ